MISDDWIAHHVDLHAPSATIDDHSTFNRAPLSVPIAVTPDPRRGD